MAVLCEQKEMVAWCEQKEAVSSCEQEPVVSLEQNEVAVLSPVTGHRYRFFTRSRILYRDLDPEKNPSKTRRYTLTGAIHYKSQSPIGRRWGGAGGGGSSMAGGTGGAAGDGSSTAGGKGGTAGGGICINTCMK
jgi:hypothetical protein